MERTPLGQLGNILPSCLTLSGRKKLNLFPVKALGSLHDTIATIVKPTPKAVSEHVDCASINYGEARPKTCSENDGPTGPPGTPLKPEQTAKPGEEREM